ncbi:MAG: ribonuclease P protein component [Candidatus Paceibacterota bacterium]
MLPSVKRLSRNNVNSLLLHSGLKVVFNRLGTLKYVNSLENAAFTVVTGAKNQKKAVLRNKVRRQLYTLFNKNKDISFIGILYVSKQVYDMSYMELKTNLDALVKKTA